MRILGLIIISALITGCVSKSKFEELDKSSSAKITELESQLADAKGQIEIATKDKKSLRADLEKLAETKKQAEERIAEYKKLNERFRSLIDAGKLSVKIVRGRMVVALSSDILFKSGSAKLSAEGEVEIEEVTKVLMDIPDREFQIEGHTDNVPIRTSRFASNWELASGRALAVLNTMTNSGFPGNRVSVASFADTKPTADNATKEGKAANRRIEIVVIPDLSQLPGVDELQ